MNFDFKPQPLRPKAVIIAIVVGFLIGSGILLISGLNPLEIFSTMFKGAFGSQFSIASTVRWSTPLLFTALAAAIAFRGGMFNMGVEGQMYIGAFATALVGFSFQGLPGPVHMVLCLLAGILGGVLWAAFPAVMKVKFGASEMVMTLMLNYAATNLTDYLTRYHFLASGVQGQSIMTDEIAQGAQLAKIWPDGSAHYGIFIALICAVIFWIIMNKTKYGYEVHVSGLNPEFARYGGVNVNRVRVSVMLLSGAFAGLAGATEMMGITGRYMSAFSPDYGWDGLVAALIGNSTPVGVLFGSVFLGAVKAGSLQVERVTDASRSVAMIIQGLMVTFISCSMLGNKGFFKTLKEKIKNRLQGGKNKNVTSQKEQV